MPELDELLEQALAYVRRSREREDLEARFAALEQRLEQGRSLSLADIRRALEEAPDEELEEFARALEESLAAEAEEATPESEPEPEPEPKPEAKPEPKARRPRRKHGDMWQGEDGWTYIHVGPDEPDEEEAEEGESE